MRKREYDVEVKTGELAYHFVIKDGQSRHGWWVDVTAKDVGSQCLQTEQASTQTQKKKTNALGEVSEVPVARTAEDTAPHTTHMHAARG